MSRPSDERHTPGPWRLDDHIHTRIIEDGYHLIDAGRGYPEDKVHGPGFGLAGCMSLSDARLIAAAPNLLKALEGLVEAEKDITDYENGDVDYEREDLGAIYPRMEAARAAARAAIAKAKGHREDDVAPAVTPSPV